MINFINHLKLKKILAENKINQMKEAAIKEIKDASIKIAVDSVKKLSPHLLINLNLIHYFKKI